MEKYNRKEVDKRRTFGIISHPDAGKTTLTEKLLLFGGAIQQAGAVKARKAARHAVSDWMEIEKEPLKFTGIPNFAPEYFRRVTLKNPLKIKHLQKGLKQLAEEGAVQVFRPITGNDYILGVIGRLQFDITMARLKSEYGVDAVYEPVDYKVARWVDCGDPKKMAEFEKKNSAGIVRDSEGTLAFLTTSEWNLGFYMEQWPDISFYKTREIA